MPDFYKVLGLPRGADDKDVRQAYRRLARQHHPDVNPDDSASEEKFKAINEAYSVLSDPDKRRRYDRHGDNWEHADRIQESQARSRHSRGSGRGGISVEDLFSGMSSSQGNQGGIFDRLFTNFGDSTPRSQTTDHPVEVTLEEAFQGAARLVSLANGRRLEVKIPPGVDNGSKVHIPAGGARQGGLNLVVTIKPHVRFERKGNDLYSDVEIPLSSAILGGDVNVATMKGQVSLTIPPESQNGQRFRLAGRGMPTLSNPSVTGDHYATIKVVLPTKLSGEEQELFQRLRDIRPSED